MFVIYACPIEAKRQRDKQYNAKNKDDILKCQRQAQELKKQSMTKVNDENTLCVLIYSGESEVTQVPNRTSTGSHVF